MATTFNPGEPVFDQVTGDLVINPTTGDAVIVEPDSIWTTPTLPGEPPGDVYQQDDVANAVFYRANTFLGEVLRDASLGVDFAGIVFASPVNEDAIVAEIRSAAKSAPGVSALTDGRLVNYSATDRSVGFVFRARKKDGGESLGFVEVNG